MKKFRLKEVASVLSGQSAPQNLKVFGESGIPFIRAGSLKDLLDGKVEKDLELINKNNAEKYNLRLFPKNTIVFPKSGMSAKIGRVYKLKESCYVVSHLAAIIPGDSLYPDYLLYWLNYNSPSRLIPSEAYPSIRISSIDDLIIPIPDYKKQKHLSGILRGVETIHQKRKESLKLLDEFLKSTFLDMFGDPISNSKKWNIKPIGELVNPVEKINPKKHGNLKIEYVDISSINRKTKSISKTTKYSGPKVPGRARQILSSNDILVSTVRPNLNSVAVVNIFLEKDIDHIIGSTGFCVLRVKNDSLNFNYLFQLTKSKYFISSLVSKVKGANYPAVSNKIVLDVNIPVPPIDLQEKFADIVKQTELLKFQYQDSEKELDNLFNALMQRAFKGEL